MYVRTTIGRDLGVMSRGMGCETGPNGPTHREEIRRQRLKSDTIPRARSRGGARPRARRRHQCPGLTRPAQTDLAARRYRYGLAPAWRGEKGSNETITSSPDRSEPVTRIARGELSDLAPPGVKVGEPLEW